jgi:hypothetical protein
MRWWDKLTGELVGVMMVAKCRAFGTIAATRLKGTYSVVDKVEAKWRGLWEMVVNHG